jgi:hypothetical protein
MRYAWIVLVCLGTSPLSAEIYKEAVPTDHGIEFYWWPVLKAANGWTHDEGASRANGVNAFVPTGYSFSDAPAVIYARAIYKPRVPETKTLAQLISDDGAEFKSHFPGVEISELPPLRVGAASNFRYFSFKPMQQGSFELVAYGEEPEFYLIFTVSGKTLSDLAKARPAFEKMVSNYQ